MCTITQAEITISAWCAEGCVNAVLPRGTCWQVGNDLRFLWSDLHYVQAEERGCEAGLLHHADWMASLLHGSFTCTDWHNAARLGYNAASQAYPPWLLAQASQLECSYVTFVL